jgi:hypothetical protein
MGKSSGRGGARTAFETELQRQRTERRRGGLFVLDRAFSFRHCLPQQKFDLRIHTAQIIRRPLLDLFPQIRRDPEQKGFALFRGHVRCRACRY